MTWQDILKRAIHGGPKAAKFALDNLIEQRRAGYEGDVKYIRENLQANAVLRKYREKYTEIRTEYFTDRIDYEKKFFDGIRDLRLEIESAVKSLPEQPPTRSGDLGTYPEGETISGRTQRLDFDDAMENNQ